MKLDLEPQVVTKQALEDFPEAEDSFIFGQTSGSQPNFVETVQQIINGLPEQIALLDDRWVMLAANPAWARTASLYGYDGLGLGVSYLDFCTDRAKEGHTPAAIVADGIREMERTGRRSFHFTYHGTDRWEGHSFQICINRFELFGRMFATTTRYEITELVHLRQMREEFSHSLIEHQAEERRRIAREVHDSTMQLLAGIGLSIGQLKQSKRARVTVDVVHEIEELLGEAQRELRAISFLAHPPLLGALGLRQALRQLAGGFARRTGLNIAINADVDLELSSAAEVAVYRMVQEALSNVHRHAHASDAAIGLFQRRSMMHVAVADNGIGMPEHVRRGVGLASMRERIDELGGRLMIRAGNPGTVVIASIPAHAEIRSVGDLAQAS
jgi:two-component system, NarL family, sensor kinase